MFTNGELKYVYLVKYYSKKGHKKLTINGWTRLVCNGHRSNVAKNALEKMKNVNPAILEEDGTVTDCNKRVWTVYTLNDRRLVEFCEANNKLMKNHKLFENIIWRAWDWVPDFKPDEV